MSIKKYEEIIIAMELLGIDIKKLTLVELINFINDLQFDKIKQKNDI